MIRLRRAGERGRFDHGWLQTQHTFSFGEYRDRDQMGYHALRVINEDIVAPGQGFGMHPHRDMEIVTLVLSGSLEHRDSLGNGEILRPGELQRMTAGTGILHSEFNPSATEPVHLYQIWIRPRRRNLPPSYEQKMFAPLDRINRWQIVASPEGGQEVLTLDPDARVLLARVEPGASLPTDLPPGRAAWLQVLAGSGTISAGEISLDASAGDGLAIDNERRFDWTARETTDLMLFDLYGDTTPK